MEVILRYQFGGLILGGAYFRNFTVVCKLYYTQIRTTAFNPLNLLLQICGKHFKAVPLYFVSIFIYRDVDKGMLGCPRSDDICKIRPRYLPVN